MRKLIIALMLCLGGSTVVYAGNCYTHGDYKGHYGQCPGCKEEQRERERERTEERRHQELMDEARRQRMGY